MKIQKGFSKEVIYAGQYLDGARKKKEDIGRTDRYSTGIPNLDEYLFGGYGRKNGWEILILHGSYKTGKSTVALQFLADPIRKGTRVGIMALEDDPEDVVLRLCIALDDFSLSGKYLIKNTVRFLPEESMERSWSLADLADEIENWFTDPMYGVDIVLLDHLQFAFDAAEGSDKRWEAEARFIRQINAVMKKLHRQGKPKTLILVSQENRAGEIAGSMAMPRAASKLIRVSRADGAPHLRQITLEAGRSTAERAYPYLVEMMNMKVSDTKEQIGTSKPGW